MRLYRLDPISVGRNLVPELRFAQVSWTIHNGQLGTHFGVYFLRERIGRGIKYDLRMEAESERCDDDLNVGTPSYSKIRQLDMKSSVWLSTGEQSDG